MAILAAFTLHIYIRIFSGVWETELFKDFLPFALYLDTLLVVFAILGIAILRHIFGSA